MTKTLFLCFTSRSLSFAHKYIRVLNLHPMESGGSFFNLLLLLFHFYFRRAFQFDAGEAVTRISISLRWWRARIMNIKQQS